MPVTELLKPEAGPPSESLRGLQAACHWGDISEHSILVPSPYSYKSSSEGAQRTVLPPRLSFCINDMEMINPSSLPQEVLMRVTYHDGRGSALETESAGGNQAASFLLLLLYLLNYERSKQREVVSPAVFFS